MRIKTSALVIALGLPVVAGAQATTDTLSLAGRTNIMFGIGLTGSRDAAARPGQATTHTTGEVGSFGFNHWVRPEIAVQITASVLNADATADVGRAHTNAIAPILFGVSYSPRALALTPSIRPFVSGAVGPYFHTVSDASPGKASTTTESVAGARLAVGTNWFVAKHFMLSVEGDYNAVGRFSEQDAVTASPSGFGMLFGFGFSWGGKY